MTRLLSGTAPLTVVLATLMMPSVRAADMPARLPQQARPVSQSGAVAGGPVAAGVPVQAGYVRLGAPMYPSPQPTVPIWAGSTMITSPALAPHEMLYPHTYRGIYPPFYHRVKGHYYWTPFGMKSHEKWELQGTMVEVKYRSSPPLFNYKSPPYISMNGGPWY